MRVKNTREIILSYLQKKGECSRIELSKALGFTKATITAHTSELVGQGILIEKGETILDDEAKRLPKRGRRTVSIEINKNYKLTIGIVVFKEGICAGLTNLQGEILQKLWRYHEKSGQQALLELITNSYHLLLNENCIEQGRLLALSISVSNANEVCEGKTVSEQLSRLKRDLSHAISVKIVTGDLAGGAILAHKLFLKEDITSAIMLMAGNPIGVAVYLNELLYTGISANAGGLSIIGEALAQADLQDVNTIEILAEKIALLSAFFDTQAIYGLGEPFLEADFIKILNLKLLENEQKFQKNLKQVVTPSYIRRETAFLSPSAKAVYECLF